MQERADNVRKNAPPAASGYLAVYDKLKSDRWGSTHDASAVLFDLGYGPAPAYAGLGPLASEEKALERGAASADVSCRRVTAPTRGILRGSDSPILWRKVVASLEAAFADVSFPYPWAVGLLSVALAPSIGLCN